MQHHTVLFSILGAAGYVLIASGLYFGSALSDKLTRSFDDGIWDVTITSALWPVSLMVVIFMFGVRGIEWIGRSFKNYHPHVLRQRIVEYRLQREIDLEEEEADRQARKERDARRRQAIAMERGRPL